MKVSVLIPAYNAAPYIEQTLDSVLAQTWPHVEVVVVDDGSRDDTLAKARRYASEKVQVVSQANAGASAARNRAFALATGDYIQYLDADDLLHPDKIRAQLACLQQHPGAQLAASAWAMFYHEPDEQALRPTVLWQDYTDPVQWLVTAWENGVWMQPSAWLTHRALIEAAGPWDEAISLHDDGEFFSRVLLQTQNIVFCPAAKSFYRKGLSDSLSSIRSEKATRSHLAVCQSYEAHLLAARNTPQTRLACANNYQRLIYEYYPQHAEVRRLAAARVQALGGSTAAPFTTPAFRLVNKLLGWQLSKRLQDFVYTHNLNPAAWLGRR
ncbi:glycosyltransferase family 2 protein [Hymenobacter sp. BRD128]|uniref:glycosyltransferase family 2 protein n=1 Tax=Hymenobacter sp. BRD128 TaxID=2675878 RepID=UPI001565C8EC|nr:glycosyltransferase family A protein [Hymenobacter sp. BRD128]QKG55506.1 glycosyltransferase family 2 protein [Hymenobacter sp. BRD128]